MIQPVAAQIQPPNFSNGLAPLSAILDYRQRQQNLATGAIEQQAAQARLQQEQQNTRQRQAAAQFFQNYDIASHVGEDGTIDLDQALTNPQLKATGDAYPAIANQIIEMKNRQLQGKTALANLNGELRQQFYSNVGGLSDDPDVKDGNAQGAGKVLDAIDQFSASGGPDAARVAAVYKPVIQNLMAAGKTDRLQKVLRNFQLQAMDAGKQTEQTYGAPTNLNEGGIIQPGVQAPAAAGGGFTPSGPPIAKTPEVIPGPAGQLLNRDPATGALSLPPQQGAPSAGGAATATTPDLNPTRAQVETQQGLAKGVTQRVSQAQEAANSTVQAQDALNRARVILDSPFAPHTGKGFQQIQDLKNLMSTLGIDTRGAEDANSLVKNLARYEAQRALAAGLGHTDAARDLSHAGSPNVNLDNKALQGIVTQSLATERALSAYANVQTRTQGLEALKKNEADFRNIPHLIEGYEYGLARNPEEANEFLKKHGLTPEQMREVRKQIKEFEGR